jgi:hypothetical protein
VRVLLLSALLVAVLPGTAHGACISMLTWRGDDYVGHRLRAAAGTGLSPQAIVPACNDAGQNDPDTKTDVRRVRGVDPRAAITTGGDTVYVNTHTFPELKSHPLHRRLHYPDRPRRRRGARCTVVGTAHPGPGRMFISNRHGVTYVDVAVDTEITLRRGGIPYIATGEEISVTGRPCRVQDHSVSALRITRG